MQTCPKKLGNDFFPVFMSLALTIYLIICCFRNCIGQNFAMNEIKVAAAQVLRRFHLSIDDKSPITLTALKVVTRSVNGIYIKFSTIKPTEKSFDT